MDANQVAERLRAVLATTAVTQEDIARLADVSLKTVNNLVHGRGGHMKAAAVDDALDQIEQAQAIGGIDVVIRLGRVERQVADLTDALNEIRDALEGP